VKIVLFCHSLVSDWNHGNAHFLRGVARELVARGHEVAVYEPRDAWSAGNLVADHGEPAIGLFHRAYPELESRRYDESLDLGAALDGAALVIVHEWNPPALVERIGRARREGGSFILLFHDTHHRAVTAPEEMVQYDLRDYDGVLAFGGVIRDLYLERGWSARAWTWHEAADTRLFRPIVAESEGDLVWIGNWGDDERSAELREFLLEPVSALSLRASVRGVRYPEEAVAELRMRGIAYGGWVPNFEVPSLFARHRLTVHVPRRPYARLLPGIPTIRPFEAMACGIPLVSAPWDDAEGLFRTGRDYLVARSGGEMKAMLRMLLEDGECASELRRSGLETIEARHTCAHRADELLEICDSLRPPQNRPETRTGTDG
jgi:spore maturation protein CgeB